MGSEAFSKALGRERPSLDLIVSYLADSLPSDWRLTYTANIPTSVNEDQPSSPQVIDGVIVIEDPNGTAVHYAVEAKPHASPLKRDISLLLEQFGRLRSETEADAQKFMYLARYIAPQARARLESEDIAYADATGNAWLVARRPGLMIRTSGLDRDPWRGPGRPGESLAGIPAAHVVRTLIDIQPPIPPTKLIGESDVSTGTVYRVLRLLEDQRLISRSEGGAIDLVDWVTVFNVWTGDAAKSRRTSRRGWLLPRGVKNSVDQLRRRTDLEFVVGGSVAANSYSPVAEETMLTLHARDGEHLAREIGAVQSETATNLVVYEDDFKGAARRSRVIEGLPTAAASQTAFDLAVGPGREPVEGELLINWMKANEDEWRRRSPR